MDEPKPQQDTTNIDSLRRLRVLEERFVNLRGKAQLADEKLLAAEEKLNNELKALTQELVQVRRQIADLAEAMQAVQQEMSHAASQYDLKALEKYLGYWEPMQFVTKDELLAKQNLLKQPSGRSSNAN